MALAAAFGILASAGPARAQELGFVAGTLAYIASIIIELAGKLLIVFIELLLVIVKYNDFINAPAVVRGWILIRDFTNMAFLVIFIAIAYATILGVEKYEWKRLLPKLLMVAVAVNFSKTLCGVVIDAAQVVMITFVNGFKDVAAGNLVNGLGLSKMLELRELGTDENVTDQAVAVASILAVVLLVIAMTVVGVIVLMFLVRIMYLWILIILAPLAFLMAATPGGERLFQEWWDKLIRYAFVGPIMAFWLWLSFSVMAGVAPGSNLAQSSNFDFSDGLETGLFEVQGNTAAAISGISSSDQLLSYGLSIALLLYSLMAARGMAIKGSGLAGDALGKIRSGGVKLGKLAALGVAGGGVGSAIGAIGGYKARKAAWAGAKYLDQKIYAATGKTLNVKRAVGQWKEKFQETKRKDEIQGASLAYQLMAQGGVGGLTWGALGAPRDAAEWYAHGPFGIGKDKGLIRAWRTITGGPKRAAELKEQVDKQEKKRQQKLAEVKFFREALGKNDFFEEGREEFIKQHSEEEEKKILERFEHANAETDAKKRNQMLSDQVVKEHGETLTFANEWKKKIGDQLERDEVNLTPQELRDRNKVSQAEQKEEFIKEWAKRKAKGDLLSKADSAIKRDAATDQGKAEQETIVNELNTLGQARMRSQIAITAEEVARLGKDGLTNAEVEIRSKQIGELNKTIKKLTQEIDQTRSLGLDTTNLSTQLSQAHQRRAAIGVQDEQGTWHVNTDVSVIAEEEQKNKEAIKKAQDEGDTEGVKKLEEQFKKDKESRAEALEKSEQNLEQLKIKQQAPNWDADKRKEVEAQVATLEAEAASIGKQAEKTEAQRRKFEAPRGFYAGRARRLLEDEEMRKITSEESSELIADFRTALHEGDKIKAAALIKKLAKDANDNEIFNAFGFQSNAQGMHDFFNAVVAGDKNVHMADDTLYTGPSLNMDKQTAYALENDVAYINEGVNHWNTARMMEVKNGRYEQLSNEDHVKASLAEMLKKDPTDVIRNYNRLAYGGEVPRPDGSGRDFKMDALGVAIIKAFAKEYKFRYGRSEFNKNAVMNIGKELDTLAGYGVDPEYITLTRDKYASFERAGGFSAGEIAEEVFRLLRQSNAV